MIQWYPGHMAKAKKKVKNKLKFVDLVLEVLDARIPDSSRNPDLYTLLHNQKHLIILNKSDLADPELTDKWIDYLDEKKTVLAVNSIKGKGMSKLKNLINNNATEINQSIQEKGRKNRPIRIMIFGIPNVGKSALINALANSHITKTGDKPGVTRGEQWINIGKNIKLLDTPGILWPKFEDEEVGYKLAISGALTDDIFDLELVAYKFIQYIIAIKPGALERTFDIQIITDQPYDILAQIGKKRGCLMSGGKIDRHRASKTLLREFQKGNLGCLTLEKPEVSKKGDKR